MRDIDPLDLFDAAALLALVMFVLQMADVSALLWAPLWLATNAGFVLAIDQASHVRDFS